MKLLTQFIIEHSTIHYTVHPEVSKGEITRRLGFRYLSPNGVVVTNYGILNKHSHDFLWSVDIGEGQLTLRHEPA
jgi:hypothetical protein